MFSPWFFVLAIVGALVILAAYCRRERRPRLTVVVLECDDDGNWYYLDEAGDRVEP